MPASTPEKLAAARGGDRHVISQLLEAAQSEGYEFVTFSLSEKPGKDGPSVRKITLTIQRELDDLESIL